jgi:hypothetical protein
MPSKWFPEPGSYPLLVDLITSVKGHWRLILGIKIWPKESMTAITEVTKQFPEWPVGWKMVDFVQSSLEALRLNILIRLLWFLVEGLLWYLVEGVIIVIFGRRVIVIFGRIQILPKQLRCHGNPWLLGSKFRVEPSSGMTKSSIPWGGKLSFVPLWDLFPSAWWHHTCRPRSSYTWWQSKQQRPQLQDLSLMNPSGGALRPREGVCSVVPNRVPNLQGIFQLWCQVIRGHC